MNNSPEGLLDGFGRTLYLPFFDMVVSHTGRWVLSSHPEVIIVCR